MCYISWNTGDPAQACYPGWNWVYFQSVSISLLPPPSCSCKMRGSMKFIKDKSICGCVVGAWRMRSDQDFWMERIWTIVFLFQFLQHSVCFWERGKSWKRQKSHFRHFEQSVGLMRELWRESSTSLKERDHGLYYSCPSSFV